MIDGGEGEVTFGGDRFAHLQGEIRAAQVRFESAETTLAGRILGQEGFFSGYIRNAGDLQFQRGEVSGTLENSSPNVTFEQRLDLTGERAEIQNTGRITTPEVVSSADIGILAGREVTATTMHSRKHLQISADLPQLRQVKTDKRAELLVQETAKTPKLRKIENAGSTRILAETPALSDVQNTRIGHLQIETKAALPRLTNLDNLRGQLEISNASLPSLAKLNLQNGATVKVLGSANFSGLTDLTVQEDAEFLAEENTKFGKLKTLSNAASVG
jgi:hypothetical protein